MAVVFPPSPSINDEFFIAGKSFRWDGYRWRKFKSAIIDGGFANIEINVNDTYQVADGGDA